VGCRSNSCSTLAARRHARTRFEGRAGPFKALGVGVLVCKSRPTMTSATVDRMKEFAEYGQALKGYEKGEAQLFCDRLFRALEVAEHADLPGVHGLLPEGIDYGDWRRLSRVELEYRYALVYGTLSEDEEPRDAFLQAELRVSHAYLLVKHLDECRPYADELIFYQRARKQILKAIPDRRSERELEQAVRDLVDESLASEGVVDIFEASGIERPDLSILDDEFLQTFKDKPLPILARDLGRDRHVVNREPARAHGPLALGTIAHLRRSRGRGRRCLDLPAVPGGAQGCTRLVEQGPRIHRVLRCRGGDPAHRRFAPRPVLPIGRGSGSPLQ